MEVLKLNDTDFRENPRVVERNYAGQVTRGLIESGTYKSEDFDEVFGSAVTHFRRLKDDSLYLTTD